MVCVELNPAAGPVWLAQVDPAPVIDQATVPPGALAPVSPLTVAVYVIVPPKIGLTGEDVTAIVGVAAVTVSEDGADAGSEE